MIATGEVIEDYPEDHYGPSCLIFGYTEKGRPLPIQTSYPQQNPVKVITLYEPTSERWLADFKTRKRLSEETEKSVRVNIRYVLELEGKLYVIENVPAQIDPDTGEPLFSVETVAKLQELVWQETPPVRVMETPVYRFAG